MYIPASFAVKDRQKLHDFIEQHSFATLVSHDGHEPFASHLPLLLDRATGTEGRLLGHMARANAQWRHAADQQVLAMFQGPHAYVSPTWYEAANVVPTWNYVAVHVYGTLRLEHDKNGVREIVARTVNFYEANQSAPWSIESQDPDFIDRLADSIVAFAIDIERTEGKSKLSQNHPPERREKVIRALSGSDDPQSREVAELMRLELGDT